MTTSHLLTADKISYRVMYKIYGQNMFLDSCPRALLHEIGMGKTSSVDVGRNILTISKGTKYCILV